VAQRRNDLAAKTLLPLVLIGAEVLAAPPVAALPRRPGVVVVTEAELAPDDWATAVQLGAERVIRLPADEAWLLDRAATYLQSRGERAHARPLIERARNLRCSTVGDDHPDTLGSATHLAATLRELGQHEPARQLGEDALTRMRRVLGDNHPDTLRWAHHLAAVLADRGEHDQERRLGRPSA
jgi:hypothetical protein